MILNYFYVFCLFFIMTSCVSANNDELYIESYSDTKLMINDYTFNTEIASTKEQKAKGMMFRPNIKENQAMLFAYESPRKMYFWMKNMLIPLDILFFDKNKKLVEIKKNVPPCLTSDCPTYPTQLNNSQFVLEIKSGLADSLNIKVGDHFLQKN